MVRYGRLMHEHVVRATIRSGTVEGFTRDGVHRWRSIPFAQPPVGPLRFRAPRPVQPWPGVRYCHGFANCAPQQRMYTALGVGKYQSMGEDCLTLNVTTPKRRRDEPMPVMVFIHGGGYILGSSATPIYDGAALARKGCVYVSVNYRVGALGCLDLSSLSTRDVTIEDNLFLRDLVMALRWVRDNIAVFGGDPDNVTIFGESAGAQAVATLLAVPAAKGLFAQAISESPASGMVGTPEVRAEYAEQFAAAARGGQGGRRRGGDGGPPAELVNALDELIRRSQTRHARRVRRRPDQRHRLPAARPGRGHAHGDRRTRCRSSSATTPTRAGCSPGGCKLLPTNESMIEGLLGGLEPEHRERITAAYPGYPDEAACIRLGGDFAFGTAAWQIAEAHSMHAPTYRYRYDYAPRTLHWSGLGATHAHRTVRRLRRVPHEVRLAAHRGCGRAVRAAGQRRRADPLARVQPHRCAGRRLARLHPLRPCGDGVRPPVPCRATTRTPNVGGVGRLLAGGTLNVISRAGLPANRLRGISRCDCVIG